jgi:quercetin dioxygenase-like cupin family protein
MHPSFAGRRTSDLGGASPRPRRIPSRFPKGSSMKRSYAIGSLLATIAAGAALAQTLPAGFAQTLPDQVKWTRSASIPPGGQSAILYGDPRKPGLYVTRVKLPADYRIAPHVHPEERVYTVISGTFYIGFGDKFDPARLLAFPPGSVIVVPANASHFHWSRSGEAVVQVSAIGPTEIEYVDRADDPRK